VERTHKEVKCLYHPDRQAAGLCSYCGAYICASCGVVHKDKIICRRCLSQTSGPVLWEQSRVVDLPWNFIRVLKGVFLSPNLFFMGLPQKGNLVRALLFAIFCELIANALILAFGGAELFLQLLFGPYITSQTSWYLFSAYLLVGPLFTVASTFITSAVFQVTATLFGGKGSFSATFRVVAYASAANLLSAIPSIGGMLTLFMSIIIYTIGFIHIHQLKPFRAGLTAFLPLVAFIVLLTLVALVIFQILGIDLSYYVGV